MVSHPRPIPASLVAGLTALLSSGVVVSSAQGDYIETYQTWQVSTAGSWEEQDLSGSPYNVPAGAVVEVAVQNLAGWAEYWGGARAVGSSLNRYFQLHEPEGGGRDWVVLHVQADANSKIECYAEDAGQVAFTLLGYWDSGTYVEAMQSFQAGADASWQDHDLSAYGVGADEVAEIVLVNNNAGAERLVGVRTDASTLIRTVNLHEPESGGDDLATMFVEADGINARIEVYAAVSTEIDFYLVGYWSTAPGTYTEKSVDVGSPSSNFVWEDMDLSADVPAYAVAEFMLENGSPGNENRMGARQNASSLSRYLDIQEAESGGGDYGRMHVAVDSASVVELYHEDISDFHTFLLTGYWTIPGAKLDNHSAGQEQDAFNAVGAETDAELFAFRLLPNGASTTVTQLVFRISDIGGLVDGDWADLEICVDADGSGDIDVGETATVGGAGVVSQAAGTVTFSTSFDVTAATDYILRADFASLSDEDAVTIGLDKADITTADTVAGSTDSITHLEGCFYWQRNDEWQATSAATWETVDLSGAPYGVPGDAVLEIAVTNRAVGAERWAGVRAIGSGLNRYFQLHEAEGLGWDTVVLHVQADADSRIQHYAETTADVTFVLLGFWDCGTYVERFDSFTAGASGSWEDVDLSAYGVGANDIAEVVLTNSDQGAAREAGVRTDGSVLVRIVDLHEAEAGGVETVTMGVRADWSGEVEVYAEQDSFVTFYHVGYWSDPPRDTYDQTLDDIGSPSADAAWEDADLTNLGVPANAITEFALANTMTWIENEMGVRANGTSLDRLLEMHEAEPAGSDYGRLHVMADGSSTIEFYHGDVSNAHTFYLMGVWYDCTAIAEYEVTDLGALVAIDSSWANGINRAGHVAGADIDATGNESAWYWDGSTLNSLGALPGGSISEARDINDLDEVVGWSDDASGFRKAFFWDGSLTDLGTVGGRTDSEALAINGNSEIVGTVLNFGPPPGERLAFLDLPAPAYTLPAGMNSLGTLGGLQSSATDINDAGQVVGRAENAGGYMRPFLWENGVMSDLGTLGGESYRITHGAMALNEHGEVVGQSYTAGGDAHAFLYLPAAAYGLPSGMNDLGALGTGDWSWAFDINHRGQVVGCANDAPGGVDSYAFVWEEGAMSDLNDLIDPASGWVLVEAVAINDEGDITGWGVNGGGDVRAFLLTRTCLVSGSVSLSESTRPVPGAEMTDPGDATNVSNPAHVPAIVPMP